MDDWGVPIVVVSSFAAASQTLFVIVTFRYIAQVCSFIPMGP